MERDDLGRALWVWLDLFTLNTGYQVGEVELIRERGRESSGCFRPRVAVREALQALQFLAQGTGAARLAVAAERRVPVVVHLHASGFRASHAGGLR